LSFKRWRIVFEFCDDVAQYRTCIVPQFARVGVCRMHRSTCYNPKLVDRGPHQNVARGSNRCSKNSNKQFFYYSKKATKNYLIDHLLNLSFVVFTTYETYIPKCFDQIIPLSFKTMVNRFWIRRRCRPGVHRSTICRSRRLPNASFNLL